MRYRICLIAAPALLLAAAACATPTTAKPTDTLPGRTAKACDGALLGAAPQPSPPCATQAFGLTVSPMPATTPIRSSPTPPPSASPGTGSPTPTAPNITPTATVSAGHTLTVADNGAAVTLSRGQHLDLLLAPDGLGAWDRPIIDGTSLTITSASGGYPSNTPLHVTFTAGAAGDATIRTGTDLACFHTTPKCLPPVKMWSVTVHITP